MLNYFHRIFPDWTKTYVDWALHSGKQHGLQDMMDRVDNYDLVIVPDAGTNDLHEHEILFNKGIPTIVLDHHEADIDITNSCATIINNQICNYPNKFMSGVGIVWQFCRYIDSKLNANYANNFLDLVALGLTADMMSLREKETKHLIITGFQSENIKNPFIYYMADKNKFSLGDKITSIGAAFYIAPFVNAMTRSGTLEEKEMLFQSMLDFKAFEEIPSQKRGHKPGEMEKLVVEAVRIATNVKNRQTKAQDAGVEMLEKMIQKNDMLKHKALIFLLEDDKMEAEIRGLVANKFMAKYQRPCAILTKGKSMVTPEIKEKFAAAGLDVEEVAIYSGSARGCDITGVVEFKDMCANAPGVIYATGHQGAFGLSVSSLDIDNFIEYIDKCLANTSGESVYIVDYIFEGNNVKGHFLLDIANLDELWGKDIPEPYIAIKNLKVTAAMTTVYEKKNLTLKISLADGTSVMLFNAPEDLCDLLQNHNPGYIAMDIVGRANKNEWMGRVSPQLFVEDYEIVTTNQYYF